MASTAISVTVGADVTDLRTKLALGKDGVKDFSSQVNVMLKSMRDASDGVRAEMMPQLEALVAQQAKAQASVAGMTAELRRATPALNENSSALGSNRMAFMEMEHVARASADAIAAGADPMRVLAMEAPRVVQALTEMGPGAMAAIVSPAGAAVVAVAALTAALGYLEIQSIASEHALEAAKNQMALVGQNQAAGLQQYNDAVTMLGTNFGYSEGTARAFVTQLEAIQGPARDRLSDIARLAASYAAAENIAPADAAKELVKAINEGPEAFQKFSDGVSRWSQDQKDFVTQASAGHNQLGAIDAIIKTSTENWGSYGEAVKKTAKEVHDFSILAGLVGDPTNIAVPAPNLEAPKAAARAPVDEPEDRTAQVAAEYNKTLQQRTTILADVKVLETGIAAASDPAKRSELENALAAAQQKATQIHSTLEAQAFEQQMGHLKQAAAAAEQGSAQRVAALREEAMLAGQYYGLNSAQYQSAETAIADAVREGQTKNRTEYEKTEATAARLTASLVRLAASTHNSSIQLTADLVRGNNSLDQSLVRFNQESQRMTATLLKNKQEANDLILKPYRDAWQGVTGAFNSSVTGMIDGSMTFSQAMQNLAKGVLDTFVEMGLKMVEDWAEKELERMILGEASATTGAVTQITAAAAVAAANTFAAISAIPYIGPALAPEAAAASYAEVMAYTALAAFAVGTPNVPQDMLANVHAGEIIVPATFSDGLRSGDLTLGGANDNSGSGGDTHTHYAVDLSGSTFGAGTSQAQVEGWVIGAVKKGVRNGAFIRNS